jgi:hypothetical protein
MPGRHQQRPPRRLGLRWLAGALSVGIVATAGAAIMATANPAGAAPTPNPSYHPGADPATFAVTGVLDGNCQVSTGGTEVWIKPGDKINFDSSLVGLNLPVITNLVSILGGKAVGLNVTAVVDADTAHAQTIKVVGGKTTVFANAANLSSGDHTLTWTADSVAVLPILNGLGGLDSPINVQLSSNALKSGASVKWNGTIHVTNDTAQCKLAVATPQVGINVGPVEVTVPPINVGIPAPNLPNLPNLPSIPGLPGGGGPTTPGGNATTPGGGIHYTPPSLTVPEQAMGASAQAGSKASCPTAVPRRRSASTCRRCRLPVAATRLRPTPPARSRRSSSRSA